MRSSVRFLLALHALLAISITGSLACRGVMFRLENVQDYYMSRQQKAIIDLFVQKKVPLTLGVTTDFFGVDNDLISYIQNTIANGGVAMEMACNGNYNDDFSVLPEATQISELAMCSDKLFSIFGVRPQTFIPPSGTFSSDTRAAMNASSPQYTHLSGYLWDDSSYVAGDPILPLKCHAGASTSDRTNNVYYSGASAATTFTQIQQQKNGYGYSVVSIHPYEFAPWVGGVYDELTVLQTQIQALSDLLDTVKTNLYETNIISVTNVPPTVTKTDGCYYGVVGFRLDDIQDYYMHDQQIAVMEKFRTEGIDLSIGIIANYIGTDTPLVEYIQNRLLNVSLNATATPQFEVCDHGWNHEDFTNFTADQQMALLGNATRVLNTMFGVQPKTFISPYNTLNGDTIKAMQFYGYTHISAGVDEDAPPYNQTNPYHFPEDAWTSNYDEVGYYKPVSSSVTFASVQSQMSRYGFSVVMIHPYEYASCDINSCDDSYLNTTQVDDLHNLFAMIKQAGYKVVPIGQMEKYVGGNANQCANVTTTGTTSQTTGTQTGTATGSGSTGGGITGLITGFTSGITSGWTSGITSGGGIGGEFKGFVIFRLDMVMDHFYSAASSTIMQYFASKNIPLTIGVSAGDIGSDPTLKGTITALLNKHDYDFEVACGGLLLEDYSALSLGQQVAALQSCSGSIKSKFGVTPTSFIPPMGKFSKNTITAMVGSGFNVMSSLTSLDAPPYIDHSTPITVMRWPANSFTGVVTPDGFDSYTATQTLQQLYYQMSQFGFGVVSINPAGFSSAADSGVVSEAAMSELQAVVEALLQATDVQSTVLSQLGNLVQLS